MITSLQASLSSTIHHHHHHLHRIPPSTAVAHPPRKISATNSPLQRSISHSTPRRRTLLSLSAIIASDLAFSSAVFSDTSSRSIAAGEFSEIPGSGGVKALDLIQGSGPSPVDGDLIAIHYYGRLAAKQGWRFDSTYDHKDGSGESLPFVFTLGSGKVIAGIEAAVKSMKVGGIRRIIIPPSQGYQSTSQEPIPPNFFDRQRLFTTIFNPTRLANGEGSTLGTLVFDIELVRVRHQ
ncbi:Peptidyl-prolyl cis-trans isomerase FKBP17-1, chloroplastic-like protein [Drosera capensis]